MCLRSFSLSFPRRHPQHVSTGLSVEARQNDCGPGICTFSRMWATSQGQQKGDRFPKGLCVQNNYPVSLTPWRFSRHTQARTRSHSHACAHYIQPHTCTITFTHAMHHTLRPYIHTPHMQTHALTHRYMTTHMHTFPLLQTTHIHMCTYITHSHMTYTYTHYTTHSHSLGPHTLQVALHSGLKPRSATCAHRFTPGFSSGSPPRRLSETIFPAC